MPTTYVFPITYQSQITSDSDDSLVIRSLLFHTMSKYLTSSPPVHPLSLS